MLRTIVRHLALATPALAAILPTTTFDLLVIGSGSAGIGAAKGAASLGKSVALIEKARVFGGDCTWVGCVPSKTLLATAKTAHAVRTAHKYGVHTGGGGEAASVTVDYRVVREQLDSIRQRIYEADDSPEVFESLGVTPVLGAARFVDRQRLEVTDPDGSKEILTARKGIVIATGAQPRPPNLPGLAEGDYLTYESIWSLDQLPSSLAVIGGGPIGCELAQGLARLGTDVTIIASTLLPSADGDAGGVLAEVFAQEGIKLVAGRARSVSAADGAKLIAVDQPGGGTTEVRAGALLVATGRVPVTSQLGLERIGVELAANGGIKVDGTLQTTAKGVYAAGDCTGDQQFTHYAVKQGVAAMTNVVFARLPAALRLALGFGGVYSESVPACTFTSPEVASVGLSEARAVAKLGAGRVRSVTRPLGKNDGAIAGRADEHGFIKLVFQAGSTTLLGATIVAPGAGEMIGEISVALANRMKLSALGNVMHAYPSLSWGIQLSALDVYGESMGPLVKLAERIGLA